MIKKIHLYHQLNKQVNREAREVKYILINSIKIEAVISQAYIFIC